MRGLISVWLLLICASVLPAQFYQSAGDSQVLDSLFDSARSQYLGRSFEKAISYYAEIDSLLATKLEADERAKEHQIYAQLRMVDCYQRLRQKEAAAQIMEGLSNLEDDGQRLTATRGLYLYLKGKMEKDLSLSQQYLIKGGEIMQASLPANHTEITLCYDRIGETYRRQKDYETAKDYMQQSLKMRKKQRPLDSALLVASYINLFLPNYYEQNYFEAKTYLDSAYTIAEKALAPDHHSMPILLGNLGVIYGHYNDYNKALSFAKKGLENIHYSKPDITNISWLVAYFSVASNYFLLNKPFESDKYLDSAKIILDAIPFNAQGYSLYYLRKSNNTIDKTKRLQYLNKALDIVENDENYDIVTLASIYNNLSLIHSNRGNNNQALHYLLKADELVATKKPKEYDSRAVHAFNLGDYYLQQGNRELAIEYYLSSIEFRKKMNRTFRHYETPTMLGLANLYFEMGEIKQGEKWLSDATEILEAELPEDHYLRLAALESKAIMYTKQGNQEGALEQIDLYLKNMDAKAGFNVEGNSKQHLFKASILEQLGDKEKLFSYLESVLLELAFEFTPAGRLDATSVSENNLWEAFNVFEYYFKQKAPQIAWEELDALLETGSVLIHRMRPNYFFDLSESEFQSFVQNYHDFAIDLLANIDLENRQASWLARFYGLIEESKSISVNRSLNISLAITNGIVDQAVVYQEKEIKINYELAFEEYIAHESVSFPDTVAINLRKKMSRWEKKKASFVDSLKKHLPEYYAYRFTPQSANLDELLEQSRKQVIFVFHWGNDYLSTLKLKDGAYTLRQQQREEIENTLVSFQALVSAWSQRNIEQNIEADRSQFAKLGHELYTYLLDDLGKKDGLMLIVDGPLVNLSFDILLTENPESNTSYKDFPYLIKELPITYLTSASQLGRPFNYANSTNKYAGFAPSYPKTKTESDNLRTEDLSPLLFNEEEIEAVAALIESDHFFINDQATKINFQSSSANAECLHLAMHATINDDVSMDSYLSFVADSTENNNGRLYAHEISQMQLDNKLVVLSACETNVGKQRKGEGLLGLAKAFQQANSSNLLISNWVVDDKAAKKIVYQFFTELNDGVSAPAALRNAKLNYLTSSPVADNHPVYWATFTYFGDPALCLKSSGPKLWLIAIGFILLALLLKIFFLRKKE